MEIVLIVENDFSKIEIKEENCFLKSYRKQYGLVNEIVTFLCTRDIQPGDEVVIIQNMNTDDEYTWIAQIEKLSHENLGGERCWQIKGDRHLGLCWDNILFKVLGKIP